MVAKKIEAGLYEYKGYCIENMKDRAGARYSLWNIAKIPTGGDVSQSRSELVQDIRYGI